jgi:hypothetical protein
MYARRWYWIWGLVGACAGFLLGFVAEFANLRSVFRPVVEQLRVSPYETATLAVGADTRVLNKLRSGAIDDAAQILEDDLYRGLYTLGSYEDVVPVDRRDVVTYSILRYAAEYRRQYPRPPHTTHEGDVVESEATDAQVARALALGERSSQNRAPPNNRSRGP